MKTRRILYGICMALLLVSGLYSGERLFVVGFVIMVMVLVLSIVSVLYTAATFKYLQSIKPLSGMKGDILDYAVEVHNDMLFPIPFITFFYDSIDSLLAGKQESVTLSLMPRMHGERHENVCCRYRGRWPIGIKSVEIRDFFGLICLKLDVTRFQSHKLISLLVRPRIIHLTALPIRHKNDESPMQTAPRQTDDMAMLSDIRKYRIGDQMKKIHWKLSARQREIMVKNYEENSLPDLLLYLDTTGCRLDTIDRLNLEDTLVECTTAVVHYLLESYLPTSLIYYDESRIQLQGSRPEHFLNFYAALSELPFDGKWPAEDVLMNDLNLVTHTGNLFLISWHISEKLFDLLMLMNSSGLNISIIYVYEPEAKGKLSAQRAGELIKISRMLSEMRNAGIIVIDLKTGDNLAERVSVLK